MVQKKNLAVVRALKLRLRSKILRRFYMMNICLWKLDIIDFVAKKVKYHHTCRKAYLSEAKCQEHTPGSSTYHHLRDIQDKAFQTLCEYVAESVIQNSYAERLSSLHTRHTGRLFDNGEYDSPYASQKLCDKLLSNFD